MCPRKYLLILPYLFALNYMAGSDQNGPTAAHRQKDDPALQQALDELIRLASYTEAGLNYTEYSDRLLTAKASIDVALQHTTDTLAGLKIQLAVTYYVGAREAWERKIQVRSGSGDDYYDNLIHTFWEKGRKAASRAEKYAWSDHATRQQIDESDRAETAQEEAELAENDRREKAAENERAAKFQPKEPVTDVEKKRWVEAADRERKRRFAPEGTVYNLKPITVTTQHQKTTVAFGTELKLIKKNSDGTVHIEKGELQADVPGDDVTNDRDVLAAFRTLAATAQAP